MGAARRWVRGLGWPFFVFARKGDNARDFFFFLLLFYLFGLVVVFILATWLEFSIYGGKLDTIYLD